LTLSMMPDACASWANRARDESLATISGRISLRATFLRVAVCSATNTAPMPPALRRRSTR
jgi:hypothetical protein